MKRLSRSGRREGKLDEVAARVQAVLVCIWRGQNLQGRGAAEFSIMCGFGGKEVVSADIHDEEGIVGDKAEAIGSGGETVATDFDGRLSDEISLILLLDGTRVAGGIDEGGKEESVCRESDADRVTGLDGGALSAEVDGGWQDGSRFGGIEDLGLCGCSLRDGARRGESKGSEYGGREDVT